MTSTLRKITLLTLASAVTLTILTLVAFSPLALGVLSSASRVNWKALSDVGQTYGAISALLAALALGGVAVSVFLQARQTRYARWEASRARHSELVRFALERPHYQQVFGISAHASGGLFAYLNLMLQHWMTLWEFGDMSDRQLRQYLHDVFSSEAGRAYWITVSEARSTDVNTKRERQFHQIACQEFEQAKMTMPMTSNNEIRHPAALANKTMRIVTPWIAGVACGAALSRLACTRRRIS
jgi:hypothetical protein